MDPVSIATALVGSQMADVQMAVAAKMLRMNADNASAIVQVLDAAQKNLQSLANVAKASAAISISARNRIRVAEEALLLPERRLDQLDGVVARPFGWAGNGRDLAPFGI